MKLKALMCVLSLMIVASLALAEAPTALLKMNICFQENESDPNYIFTRPTQFVFDRNSNFYVVDRGETTICKFDGKGRFIKKIASKGSGPGELRSIRSLHIVNDNLLTFDERGMHVFSLEGEFLAFKPLRSTYSDKWDDGSTVYVSLNKYITHRRQYNPPRFILLETEIEAQREKVIASQDATGRINAYRSNYTEFVQLLYGYVFDVDPSGDVIFADAYNLEIFKYSRGKVSTLIKENYQPDDFDEHDRKSFWMRPVNYVDNDGNRRKAAPLKPKHPEMIKNIVVSENGDIWVYIRIKGKQGVARYSRDGKPLTFYEFLQYDLIQDIIYSMQVHKGDIYFNYYDQQKGFIIYKASVPGLNPK